MPVQKDFKRLVRARMQKTGESYTAARAILLDNRGTPPTPRPTDYARLAGKSDAAIKAATGCTWERWVKALDRVQAHTWSHRDIANHVREKYKTPSWWTQTVTVGYERIRGLREVGQGRDGGYSISKSRTFPVPVGRLYRAFRQESTRARWLPGVDLTIRTARPNKSLRITWNDGTWVLAGFTAKGARASHLALGHQRLPSRAAADEKTKYWAERLQALMTLIT